MMSTSTSVFAIRFSRSYPPIIRQRVSSIEGIAGVRANSWARSSISQIESNPKWIARIHGAAIFGGGSIMSGTGLGEPQGSFLEPSACGRLDDPRLGGETPPAVNAYLDRDQAFFS